VKRPKIKDFENISGEGAYDYISAVNVYFDYQEQQIAELKWLVNDLQSRLSEVEPPF
jgi:hypothetical protein